MFLNFGKSIDEKDLLYSGQVSLLLYANSDSTYGNR